MNADQPNTSDSLRATGKIRVYLTQNISRSAFETQAEIDDFEILRGTDQFKNAVLGLRDKVDRKKNPGSQFEIDDYAASVQESGYEARVINQYLIQEEFLPTYKFVGETPLHVEFERETLQTFAEAPEILDKIQETAAGKLKDEWERWDVKKIRFSRYGLFQVVLEQDFKTPSTMLEILEIVLGLEHEFEALTLAKEYIEDLRRDPVKNQDRIDKIRLLIEKLDVARNPIDPSVQWELFRTLKTEFCKTWGNVLEVDRKRLVFRFDSEDRYQPHKFYPLRFRYVVFELTGLERKVGEQSEPLTIPFKQLSSFDKRQLASLLEMVPLADQPGGPFRLGNQKDYMADGILARDMASWDEELYIATRDCVLIYRGLPDSTLFRHPNTITYAHYWASIQRGIAYLGELRVIAKFLSHATTQDLEEHVPQSSAEYQWGKLEQVRNEVNGLIRKLANYSRLASSIRYASMPTTMSTADYSMEKFQQLYALFDMEEFCSHINDNIRSLNEFIRRFDDLLLQHTVQRENEFRQEAIQDENVRLQYLALELSKFFALVAALSAIAIMVIPELARFVEGVSGIPGWLFTVLCSILLALAIGWLVRRHEKRFSGMALDLPPRLQQLLSANRSKEKKN